MNGDFAGKFIWACAFLVAYSLPGEIFLFNIVKMCLTNSRRKIRHNCQTNQNTNTFQSLLYQQIRFNQIKLKMATNNMSNIHVSPDVLSNLMLSQQCKLYKLKQILHGISRTSRPEVFCEIFKNIYFEEHLWTTASASQILHSSKQHCRTCRRIQLNSNRKRKKFSLKLRSYFFLKVLNLD